MMYTEMCQTICEYRKTGKVRKDWAKKIETARKEKPSPN